MSAYKNLGDRLKNNIGSADFNMALAEAVEIINSLDAQKPAAWWYPKGEQFALASKDGSRPFAKVWEPLFAAPVAAQPPSQPVDPVHVINTAIDAMMRRDATIAGVPVAAQPTDLEAMRQQKDGAYFERNQVVAALAKCFPSGVAKTAIEGWSEDWHGCVYIDLPTGQVSWHFHDSQAYLFKDLPPYAGAWDGHDTPEKYRRVNALSAWAGLNPAEYVRASPATADFDLPAQSDEVAAQASKPLSDEPNMFWNHDDPESPYGGIGEFLNDEWSQNGIAVGDIRRVQRAIRLPDVMVRVIAVSDDGDIDYIVEPVGGIKERG
jgi:hypothetical protein